MAESTINDLKKEKEPSEGIQSIGDVLTQRQRKRFQTGDTLLGRYRILGELGQGGMGLVFRCLDEVGGIEVAVKMLPPEVSHDSGEMEDVRENFRLVSSLVHQNICAVRTLEKDPATGEYFLVMELAQGVNLRTWRKQRKAQCPTSNNQYPTSNGTAGIPLAEILPIVRQIAAALDYAHEHKVIHRDIKPSNVMVQPATSNLQSSTCTVKVLDFGLAAQIHTSFSRVSHVRYGTSGTGPYMAPEQWEGQYQDAATDQYALAVLTYELLTGHCPFESHEATVLRESVLKSVPKCPPGLPAAAWAALQRGLAKEREERFASCGEFARALGGEKISPQRLQRTIRMRGWKWSSGLAALAVLAVTWALYSERAAEIQRKANAEVKSPPAAADWETAHSFNAEDVSGQIIGKYPESSHADETKQITTQIITEREQRTSQPQEQANQMDDDLSVKNSLTHPAQIQTEAYVNLVQADQHYDGGHLNEALSLYKTAQAYYAKLVKYFPEWEPRVIQYRKTYCDNRIIDVNSRIEGGQSNVAVSAAWSAEGDYLKSRIAKLESELAASPGIETCVSKPIPSGLGNESNVDSLKRRIADLEAKLIVSKAETNNPASPPVVATVQPKPIPDGMSSAECVRQLLQEGENAVALATVQQARKSQPSDTNLLLIEGIVLIRLQRYREAANMLVDLAKKNPRNADVHATLGAAMMGAGFYEEARETLLKAVMLKQDLPECQYNLAQLYAFINPVNLKLARKYYKQARDFGIASDPQLEKALR